jgi:hypothetical protein
VRLAFYKGPGRLFDRLIRAWMRGPYSHVELVVCDLSRTESVCYSSSPRDGGVRSTVIDLTSGHWDVVDVGYWDNRLTTALVWFESHQGCKYNWWSLLGYVIRPFKAESEKRFNCATAICYALGLPDPWRHDPNSLANLFRSMVRA